MAYIHIPGRFNTPPSGPVQLRRNSDILRGVQVATSPHGTGPRRLLDMLHGKTYQTVTGNGTKSAAGSRGLGHVVGGYDYFSLPFDPAKFSSGKITAVTHVSITAASGQRGYLHIGTSDKLTPRLLLQQANADFNSYWASAFRLVASGFFSSLSARAGFTYSAGTAAVYKAGKLAASGSHPAIDFTGATELWIGGGYDYPVTGTVGEMLVWNRALSASEHVALAREWYGLIYEQNPRRVYIDMGAVVFDATPSGATVQSITATGATPKATITRSGPSPVGTLYYVIYADGLGAPSAAQVKAGQNATGAAAVASGTEACRTTTGDQVFGTPASGLTPSTAYRIAFVASDGTTDSSVAVSPSAFTTLAGSQPISGTGSATATGTADLTTAIPITGAAISVATAAGSIITAILLDGAGGATSTASGALDAAAAQLSGSAAAVAVAGGVLTAQITLSGAALAQAFAPAGLTAGSGLDGAASSESSAAADLSTGIALGGSAAGSANASGDITTEIRLSGAAIAQALATAGLTTAAAGLAGSAGSTSSASGSITTAIPLAGTASAVATGSGGLGVPIMLSGVAASASLATGDLTVAIALSGSSYAIAAASASLTASVQLSGAAMSEAAAAGYFNDGTYTIHASRILTLPRINRIVLVTP